VPPHPPPQAPPPRDSASVGGGISTCRDAPASVEIAPPSGEILAEIDSEIAEIDPDEIAAPLPLLRSAWLRGELPRAEPGSLTPTVTLTLTLTLTSP